MKRHTQKQIIHLFAGLLIVVLAFSFFEKEDVIQATVLFGAGCLFLILAGAHTWIETNIRRISSYFLFLEAATFFYAARHYKTIGHNQFYTGLMITSGLFILLGIFYLVTKKNHKRTKHRSKRRSDNAHTEF